MERLSELISKLKEQFEQKADSSKLLGITLLIERELMKLEQPKTAATVGSSNVSITMPAARNGYSAISGRPLVNEMPEEASEDYSVRQEPAKMRPVNQFLFDPMVEIPTLSHQQSAKEINELIGVREASLNDKLKEDKVEVGHVLTDHPIRDFPLAEGQFQFPALAIGAEQNREILPLAADRAFFRQDL
ncbi:MAG: hypothetical protein ABI415_11855, partial [Flavitalea sp.]